MTVNEKETEEIIKELSNKLYQTESQKEYWKTEYHGLLNKYKMLNREKNALKKEIIILNQKFNERKKS